MAWNEERVDLLKKLWSEGLSCSVMANRLGGVTRNAVIGKVHRLGLSGRVTTQRMKYRKRARAKKIRTDGRVFAPTFAREPLPPEPSRPAKLFKLADMEDHQCRYVFGDPRGSHEWGYCGCEKMPGSSFCPGHHGKVWQGVPVRSKSADIPEWRGKHRLDKHGSKYAGKAVAL
ncbi:GcrA family cell cycle regulator [uncultured Hyphomicrobium sp.]|uniref:GcrA family cell cycle regulator n=1 Tax=uncultured Hyphomicrobium sp. TaxID=194373 RepID=UPI0025F32045|nr:GcrA family cell cycle regulator [uncultured Hyphomicrobium sp.]